LTYILDTHKQIQGHPHETSDGTQPRVTAGSARTRLEDAAANA
jgi:hypothetical protein